MFQETDVVKLNYTIRMSTIAPIQMKSWTYNVNEPYLVVSQLWLYLARIRIKSISARANKISSLVAVLPVDSKIQFVYNERKQENVIYWN